MLNKSLKQRPVYEKSANDGICSPAFDLGSPAGRHTADSPVQHKSALSVGDKCFISCHRAQLNRLVQPIILHNVALMIGCNKRRSAARTRILTKAQATEFILAYES